MSSKIPAIQFDRVSSAQQLEGHSLEAQANANQDYADRHNLKIVRSWSVDESASKERDRKKFMEAVQYLKDHDVKHFIFHKVDRCARGYEAALLVERLFQDEGITFHFTGQNLRIHKDSPPHDKMQLHIHLMLAKVYVENLKGEIRKGLAVRENKGLWNYKAPIGYKNVRSADGVASVIVDGNLAPIVRSAFELYATGNYNLEEIADYVKKCSSLPVTKRLAETILKNPFYYGKISIKDKIQDGAHVPLIDEKLWIQCQKIKAIRGKFHVRGNGSRIIKPLMGFMTCGYCGRSITGEAKVKSNGKTYVYYHCGNHTCEHRKVNTTQNDLFAQIVNAFQPFGKFTPKATEAFVTRIRKEWDAANHYATNAMLDLQTKKRELADKIEIVRELRRTGRLSDRDCSNQVDALLDEYDRCTIEVGAHNVAENKVFHEGVRIIELLESSKKFMELPDNWLDKMRLVKSVLSNCTLKDGKLEYRYQFPFDSLIELTSERNWWTIAGSNR